MMKTLSTLAAVIFFAVSLTTMAQVIPGQYIVVLNDNTSNPGNAAQVLVNRHGGRVGHVYQYALKGFSFQGSAAAAQAISRNPNVAYVEADLEAHADVQELVTGVDRIDADLNTTAKIDGVDAIVDEFGDVIDLLDPDRVNVDVAIIDTGIDLDHPDLPKVVGGRHFYTVTNGKPSNRGSFQDDNYDDDGNHGTHVAGTVAALDNDIGVVGVAPGARLWAIKVLDSSGSGSFSDVIAGINWVTMHATDIEVVNMSLGGQGFMESLRTAIQASVAAGVVYVVSAGNSSMDVYGPDGIFGTNDDFIPASYPEVAAISAMGDIDGQAGGIGLNTTRNTADDTFADFTNFSRSVVDNPLTTADIPVTSQGAAIDVAGPGVDIRSTYGGGGYATASGTSMASPHVAGLVALEIAATGRANNAKDVADIRQALIDSAQAQADWRLEAADANTFDPDNNPEGLAMAVSGTPNDAPVVEITSPGEGLIFSSGQLIVFTAVASDTEDDFDGVALILSWSSDIDGPFVLDLASSRILSDGLHTITVSVTDSGGKTRSDSVSILVGNPPVEATVVRAESIVYATNGGRNNDKNLLITVAIQNDFNEAVAGASVSISLTLNGQGVGSGTATTATDGTVTFILRNAKAGLYETVVTNVQAAGLEWDLVRLTKTFKK